MLGIGVATPDVVPVGIQACAEEVKENVSDYGALCDWAFQESQYQGSDREIVRGRERSFSIFFIERIFLFKVYGELSKNVRIFLWIGIICL